MLFDQDGTPVLFDEVDLLIDYIAKEKLSEFSRNEDNSLFWMNFTNIISSFPVAGFHEAYTSFREVMLSNTKAAAELFDYTTCLTMQIKSRPYTAKALETTLSQLDAIQNDSDFATVLDKNYSTLDAVAEVLLFIRINIRPIDRRMIEVNNGPIRLPIYNKARENDHNLHGARSHI